MSELKHQWGARIDLKVDTDSEVREFIKERAGTYRYGKQKFEDLWWDFYDDFKNFTETDNFLRAGTEANSIL